MANLAGSDATTIKFRAGSNGTSGTVASFGNVAGILASNVTSGEEATLIVSGVVELSKNSNAQAFTIGTKVFGQNGRSDVRAASGAGFTTYIGDCIEANAANAAGPIKVWLGRAGA